MLPLLLALLVQEGESDYARDVRPILSRHCFKCHGPDDAARKAGLRLDQRESALQERKGRRAIVPGNPQASELVRRILSSDPDEVMPPPSVKNPLSAEKKETLRRWIAAGAEVRPHWAFVPPRAAEPPAVMDSSWPLNAIDRFVLARLEREGLRPSPKADPHTLARRVALDLTGLPPTPEEADAFARDPSPAAYAAYVDRLLASPHYGERWARRWLDLARYADTNGYEKDRARSIWPWRDWVIRALNDDLPFDQFTIQQIAGDMLAPSGAEGLPQATLDQRVATGFHRNTMLNEEGGIDPLEFRFYAMTDRVLTTGAAWLGLTIGCAQCHTHKFDPISHREYYGLMAFLDNADEPEMEFAGPEREKKRREVEEKIAALEAELPRKFPGDLQKKLAEWVTKESARARPWILLRPAKASSNLPLLTVLDDGSVLSSGDVTKRDVYALEFRGAPAGITAIRLEVLPDERLPRRGPGRVYYEGPAGDFFLSEITLQADGKPLKFSRATHSFGKNPASAALDGDPQTGWSIDGGQGRAHTAVFQLAAPASAEVLRLDLLFERYYAAGLGRFRVWVTTDARPAEALPLPSDIEGLLVGHGDPERLLSYFLSIAPELDKERKEIDALRKSIPAPPTTLVFRERPPENPRPTTLYKRGEFLQPAERVEPGIPAVLPPLPPGAARDRLSFARWLVDPGHPLTPRVTVNRQWAAFFGIGLVRTLEDFGTQGELPSHPELLDWLALEFIRQKWSVKGLHRLTVTSATYQQSSRATAELLRRDPDNRLLARGARFRIEAELVRDSALKTSGLLSPKIGGPSVFPPQPANVTTEGAYGQLAWKVSAGEDRYRRGLYTYAKRTAPYAMFTTFDASSGEACLARREVSNTPLQALTLLNDAVFVEAAQALGKMAAAAPGSDRDRAALLFRRCLVRPPAEGELASIVAFYGRQRSRFEAKELDAAAVAGAGEGAVERAAWTAAARAILNLDEMITKD